MDAITNSGNTLSVEILNKVATEKTDRESAITELKTYVDNGAIYESNARVNEDLSLSQRINDEIVNRESMVWQVGDTLSRIDSALNSRCDTIVTAQNNDRVVNENADIALGVRIDNAHMYANDHYILEKDERVAEDLAINIRLGDEIINRENSELSLSSRIDEAYMAVSSEMQAREAFDNMVKGALDSKIARSTGNDYDLQQQILAEVGARSFEDSIIRTDFNEGDRLINERLSTLGMNLEIEGTSRNDADVELSTKCADLVTSIFNEKSERKSEDVLIRASIVTVNEDLAGNLLNVHRL